MKIKIRRFRVTDAIELARMHRETIRAVNRKDYNKKQIKVWAKASAKRWRENSKNSIILIALDKNKLIGFIQLKDSEVKALYVHKNYIGRNVGKNLFGSLEDIAYKNGIKKLKCMSTVTAKNFYNKRGFKTIRKTKFQIRNQKLPVYEMVKILKQRNF